jgi:hypothetical protein
MKTKEEAKSKFWKAQFVVLICVAFNRLGFSRRRYTNFVPSFQNFPVDPRIYFFALYNSESAQKTRYREGLVRGASQQKGVSNGT